MRLLTTLAMVLALASCVTVTPAGGPAPMPVSAGPVPDRVSGATAVQNFRAAVSRVEPAAEQLCRSRNQRINCDFLIRVDPDPNAPPNAFQSLDRSGRPLLTFTQALIADARNQDEIAFVIGHESAHHIEQHIARQRQSAAAGALVGGLIGTALGGDASTVNQISRAGAQVGARSYSRDHELEADALGTVITAQAGYNPVRGAAFFTRIPDPGDRFLGTHPPNSERIATVRRVAAGL
ncbi:MAG: M48 family metallopeptidase [Pseudomonadota bacterium]